MKKNVGNIDKIIRLVIGLVILVIGYMNDSWWGLIGLIPILTALSGVCLLYAPLKINTRGKE